MLFKLRSNSFANLVLFILISIAVSACTSIPNLQHQLIQEASREDSAKAELDAEFKKQCSQGKELWDIPPKKMAPIITCGKDIFDKSFLKEARYEDLAESLKNTLVEISQLYADKKIKKKTFKARINNAWNTYNEEWLKRSQGEVNDAMQSNEKIEKAAKVGVAVIAVVTLVALAANSGDGGGGNNYANSYTGNCPCPYSRDAAGNICGARSAYTRTGGASPVCY